MRPALALVAAILAATGCGGHDGAAPAATPEAVAARTGLEVWAAHGCGSCHKLAAASSNGHMGPDLDESLKGDPPELIKESIVAPDLKADPRTSSGLMPANYAERIKPADLDALVAFIAASVE